MKTLNSYLSLLRIPDQYTQLASILFAALFFDLPKPTVILWLTASTFISFVIFIVNEATDRGDTDKYTWNHVHVKNWGNIDNKFVLILVIIFTLMGLSVAYLLNVFYWALAMWIIGVLYSLKPIRFKSVFLLDIVSQLIVWWVVPFLALIWGRQEMNLVILLLVMGGTFVWFGFYPYQIADYEADLKAKLGATHVILGINKSLIIGLTLGIISGILFLLNPQFLLIKWLWPVLFTFVATLFQYFVWLRTKNESKKTKMLQLYVRIFQPISRLLTLYLATIYFFNIKF